MFCLTANNVTSTVTRLSNQTSANTNTSTLTRMKERLYILEVSTIVACWDLYKEMFYRWQLMLAGIIRYLCTADQVYN